MKIRIIKHLRLVKDIRNPTSKPGVRRLINLSIVALEQFKNRKSIKNDLLLSPVPTEVEIMTWDLIKVITGLR